MRSDDQIEAAAAADGPQIVEATDVLASGPQVDSYFLKGLARGCRVEIDVGRMLATSWESHMPRPGVAFTLRAVNREELGARGTVAQNYRDGSPLELRIVDRVSPIAAKPFANEVDIHHVPANAG
jgi:hypothetical protein